MKCEHIEASNVMHLCPNCLHRDGSCEGTSYGGGPIQFCESYVLAHKNIMCWLGFHDWGVTSSFGKNYGDNLTRECRHCFLFEIVLKGDIFWRNSSEKEMWDIIKRIQMEDET